MGPKSATKINTKILCSDYRAFKKWPFSSVFSIHFWRRGRDSNFRFRARGPTVLRLSGRSGLYDSSLEGDGFEPSVSREGGLRFEAASLSSLTVSILPNTAHPFLSGGRRPRRRQWAPTMTGRAPPA